MGTVGKSGGLVQPELFEYGIHTEKSDIRCHVAPFTRLIFVFRTAAALGLDLTKYPIRSAYQKGVSYRTSEGWLVPPQDIPDLRIIHWHSTPWWEDFSEDDEHKGDKAVKVAADLLKAGRFPLWLHHAEDSQRVEVQKGGTDIMLWGKWRIQVKCDYRAGPGGTGNLYLQKAELNPLQRH